MKKVLIIVAFLLVMLCVNISGAFAEEKVKGNDSGEKWFFLVHSRIWAVVGPFKNESECKDMQSWADKESAAISKCWSSGKM